MTKWHSRLLTHWQLFDSISDGVGGWSTHVRGFARVIEGGGPSVFKPALDEGILVGCRRGFVSPRIPPNRKVS